MNELLHKEWRESRALIFGLLVLGPAASLGVRWLMVLGDGKVHPADPVAAIIPFLLLIYVLAIGADIVAGDASSGRIAFFAAQPVRPATLWAVKAGFLFGTAALYLGWLLGTETCLLFFSGVDPTRLFTVGLVKFGVRLIPAALAGAAVLFFSTLIDRGFAAVIAALATLALIVVSLWQITEAPERLRAVQLALPVLMLFVAFLAGSFLAFTRGRIHLGGRIRRIALATYAFLLLFGLPMAAAVLKGASAWEIP